MGAPEPNRPQAPVDFALFQSPAKRRLVLCFLLAAATIALYSPILRAPFLNYDDAIHVTENPHVRAGITWSTVVWAFRTSEASDWHPLTWLSHALDCQLFGLDPSGPHAVSLLLHVLNAILLFLILEAATGFAWRSFAAAALFALHPINVESVAWISERKNVLSMFFFLLALAAYGCYARRPNAGRYLLVTVAYACALMSKAQVITFPFALLLLDYWPLERLTPGMETGTSTSSHESPINPNFCHPERSGIAANAAIPRSRGTLRLIVEKIPWFALSAASALITMRVEAEATQAGFPLWVRLANAAVSYGKYLVKAFWPLNLAIVYPHPGFSVNRHAAIVSAIALAAVAILAFILRRRYRFFFTGWFWFVGTLVPMIGLVQISVHSMADRYAYIPLLGIFVIVVWAAAELAESFDSSGAKSGRARVPLVPEESKNLRRLSAAEGMLAALATAVALALALLLSRQISYWRDNVTLWTHTLAITDRNYTAEDMLATALLAQGKVMEAVPHLQRALMFRPDDALATLNLATFDQMRGDYASALAGYAKIPRFTTQESLLIGAAINSGYAHMSLKDYAAAARDFETVLKTQPTNAAGYRGLGLTKQRSGDMAQAVPNYQRAAELEPSVVNYLLLSQAFETAGQNEAARAAYAQAARLSPNLADDTATVKQLLTN